VSAEGLRSLGFDDHYPLDSDGDVVGHEDCRTAGARVRAEGLRGVWCRSAASADGSARELAWFPATPRSRARAVWPEPFALGGWREASTWSDLGLPEQADPSV
jgi:hypothetical protein